MISWADFYYKSGEVEKANNLVNQIADRYKEDLTYYSSLNARFAAEYQDDIQESMAVMQRLIQLTDQNKQPELSKEIEESFYAHISSLQLQ